MKISKKDGVKPNSFGDINIESLRDNDNSDYCMNEVFQDQQAQLDKMKNFYDKREQTVFSTSDGYKNGILPNSTANFTIETINENQTKFTPNRSISTEFVHSIDYNDEPIGHQQSSYNDLIIQNQDRKRKINQIQNNSQKIQIDQNLNNLNMLMNKRSQKHGNNEVRSQLQHLMKNKDASLGRILLNQQGNEEVTYRMASKNILPIHIVDRQGIETPIQYSMAVKAQKNIKIQDQKRQKQLLRNVDKLKHTRFGKSLDYNQVRNTKNHISRRFLSSGHCASSKQSKLTYKKRAKTQVCQKSYDKENSNLKQSYLTLNKFPQLNKFQVKSQFPQQLEVTNPFSQSQYDTINRGTVGAPLQNLNNLDDSLPIIMNEGDEFSLSQNFQKKYENAYQKGNQQNQLNQSNTSQTPYESNHQSYRSQSIQYLGQHPADSVHSYVNTTQSFDHHAQSKSQSQMMPKQTIIQMMGHANQYPQQYPTVDPAQDQKAQHCQTLLHPQSLGGTANTSQLQMGPKVKHIAKKYNVELNPGKQHIFDEKEKTNASIRTSKQTPSISVKTFRTISLSKSGQGINKYSVTAQSVNDVSKAQQSCQIRGRIAKSSREKPTKGGSDVAKNDSHSRSRNRQWHGRKVGGSKTAQTTKKANGSLGLMPKSRNRVPNKKINTKSRSKSRENSVQRSIRAFIGLGNSTNTGGSNLIVPAVYEQNRLESTGKTSMGIEQQIKNATLGLRQSKSKINSIGISRIGSTGMTTKESASIKQIIGLSKAQNINYGSKTSFTTAGVSQKTNRTEKKGEKSIRRNLTKSYSRKGSSDAKTLNIMRKSMTKNEIKQSLKNADEYYKQLMIRRHFCIWIEAYIGKLKLQRNTSNDDIENRSKSYKTTNEYQQSRSVTSQKNFYSNRQHTPSKSPISKTKTSVRSANSRKSIISGYSNSRQQVPHNMPGQVLFKDASKSSVPISQGFFDNVASPNSNCAIPMVNYQQKSMVTVTEPHLPHTTSIGPHDYNICQDRGILLDSSQALSLNHNTNTSNNSRAQYLNTSSNIMLNSKIQKKPNTNKGSQKEFAPNGLNGPGVWKEIDTNCEEKKKGKNNNLESMKNIISHDSMNFYNQGIDPHVNCFARVRAHKDLSGGILNSEDLQTRNVSTISGKAEFRETAQLGQKNQRVDDHQQNMNIFDHLGAQNTISNFSAEVSNDYQGHANNYNQFKKGLNILKNIDNKVLNRLLGDKTKVRSSTIKRTSRSNSQYKGSKYVSRFHSRGQPINKSSQKRITNFQNGSTKEHLSKSHTISSKGKLKQHSKTDALNDNSKYSGSLSNVSAIRTISGFQSVDKSVSELRALNSRTWGPKTISPYKSRSRSNKSQISDTKTNSKSLQSFPKSVYYQSTLNVHQTITSNDICRLQKQKHFLKWKQFTRQQSSHHQSYHSVRYNIKSHRTHNQRQPNIISRASSKPDKKWLKSYKDSNLKSKVFYSLLNFTLKQKKLNDVGYQIISQHRSNVLSQTFLVWIEKFNSTQIERKKMFYASCHWVNKTIGRFFIGWLHQVQHQIHQRFKIRQVVPMRCLLRMICQNSKVVPQQMLQNIQIGQELYLSSQFYKMKKLNEQYMLDSINVFKFSLIRSVFQKLRSNYYDVCRFKGNVAIVKARNVIQAWHYYANRKVSNRQKSEQFHCNTVIKRYIKVLNSWSYIIKKKKNLTKNEMLFTKNRKQIQKNRVFETIREHACQQNVKSLMKYRAQKIEQKRVKKKIVQQLKSYTAYRKDKNNATLIARQKYEKDIKSSTLKEMAMMCKKLADLEKKRVQVNKNHQKFSKLEVVKQWHINSLKIGRARVHNEFQLTRCFFHTLREAILMSQIGRQKKVKAQKYRHKNLKYELLWFLKEFKYEQDAKRSQRAQITDIIRIQRKRNLFQGLRDYASLQNKRKIIYKELQRNRDRSTRTFVMSTLKWNVTWQYKIYEFEQISTLKFKKQYLDCLKYSVRKQQLLRHALIQTVMSRNKQKATVILENWKNRAFQENYFKASIAYRIQQFSVKRALRKFQVLIELKIDQKNIKQLSHSHRKLRLKTHAWQALFQYHTSKKVLNSKKAYKYMKINLYIHSFGAIKQNWILNCKYLQLKSKTELIQRKIAIDHWKQIAFGIYLEKRSQTFLIKQLMKRAFQSIKRYQFLIKQSEKFQDLSTYHHEMNILKKSFSNLKNYGPLLRQYKDQKAIQYVAMRSHYMAAITKYWRQVINEKISNKKKSKRVQYLHKKTMEQKYMRMMITCYNHKKNSISSSKFYKISLERKVISYLKKQGTKNVMLKNLLKQHTIQKQIEVKKQVFVLFKNTRVHNIKFKKLEAVALDHLVKFFLKRVLQALQQRTQKQKKLRVKFAQQLETTNQKLKSKCLKEIIDCYAIQPKLDAIAYQFFVKKQINLFKKKVYYMKARNEGTNLHEFEIKAFEALGKNLMSKAFSGLRMHTQCSLLKIQEKLMADEFQHRKWFNIWRQNYLVKAQNNYFVPVMQQQLQQMNNSLSPQLIQSDHVLNLVGHAVNSHRSMLPPRYIQKIQQTKDKSNDFEREGNGFSPKTFDDNSKFKDQCNQVQNTQSKSRSRSASKGFDSLIKKNSNQNTSKYSQIPPRHNGESSSTKLQKESKNDNYYNNYNNYNQGSCQPVEQTKLRTANFQTRRVSNNRSDKTHSNRDSSMAEKAQMLSNKIQLRIAHSRESRNSLSNDESKSRSRERSNAPSGIASIRQGITIQNSMINSPISPQSAHISEQKDYSTFGNQQIVTTFTPMLSNHSQQAEGKMAQFYQGQNNFQNLDDYKVDVDQQQNIPQRDNYKVGSQKSNSPDKSFNRSQPRQNNLLKSGSPKKRGVSQSPERSNSEIRLQNEITKLVQDSNFEMHQISDQLRGALVNGGSQIDQFGLGSIQHQQYLQETRGIKGGSETKTRSFKSFLNQKNKFPLIVDSAKKSELTNSGGKSGDTDQMKISSLSNEEAGLLPQYLYNDDK